MKQSFLKDRLLVVTSRDVFGGLPNGAIFAIRSLVERLAESWDIDLYVLNPSAKKCNQANIHVYTLPSQGKTRILSCLRQIFGSSRLGDWLNHFILYLKRTKKALKGNEEVMTSPYSYKENHVASLKNFIEGRSYVAVIIEYINHSYLLDAFESLTVKKFLDVLDIMHLRSESSALRGYQFNMHIEKSEEYELMEKYDYLIAIQEDEASYLRKDFGGRVITATRPHKPVQCPFPDQVNGQLIMSLFGSQSPFNQDAFHWFMDHVWSKIRGTGILLEVAGTLCDVIDRKDYPNTNYLGRVQQPYDVYKRCHVVVNPIQMGSGLKIKNIEAMAHGRPVVTTPLGAQGLRGAVGHGLIVAEDPSDFSNILARLQKNRDEVCWLGNEAQKFISENFNANTCFSQLEDVLRKISSEYVEQLRTASIPT